ncbi:MAG: hypothetical protein GU348_05525 [Thermogladius sp.]|nr:hypothetical protein [Thermogladius sp.]
MRIIIAHGFKGLPQTARDICLEAIRVKADIVHLGGDIKSPRIIEYLTGACGLKVVGFTGRLDSELIVKALKDSGGYVESTLMDLKGISVLSIGYNLQQDRIMGVERADLLITYFSPMGLRLEEENIPGSPIIDYLINRCKPQYVVVTSCRTNSTSGRTICLGEVNLGYYAIADLEKGYLNITTRRII